MEEDDQYEELNEIEKEELRKQEASERLDRMYYSCFHSPEGEVVLKDLLNKFYRSTSIDESINTNTIIVNEGKRYVTIYILSRMEQASGRQED